MNDYVTFLQDFVIKGRTEFKKGERYKLIDQTRAQLRIESASGKIVKFTRSMVNKLFMFDEQFVFWT